ncbi:MAG: DNA starvation/stationary phase protection protein [Gammaproteobacteria bacterium]|nr:DNA starvation/stationary phase protection protein [Gammaproteobacteria bacterium]
MSSSKAVTELNKLLANTYALYLKTQNFHWHVRGPHFVMLHELFEQHYKDLAEAVDEIAERIVMLGGKAAASFKAFEQLSIIEEGDSELSGKEMLQQLAADHQVMIDEIKQIIESADKDDDFATSDLLGGRISAHEKMRWMLSASV